ncbi:MAG: murein biosynthesis integral membrane protein MurJ [Micrococcales bacterium]
MSELRSSAWMALGTIVSRILGFAKAILLAMMIGVTTNAADAFGVANQLPNNVYAIIVGGVLNAVLVPQLVKAYKVDADGGRDYINRLVTLAISVFTVITVIAVIAAPLLVQLYTHGWTQSQLALATAFAYWCLPQLFFYGMYSMFGEVLNSRSAFGPFMWAPVLNNVVQIAGMGAYILLFGFDPTGTRAVDTWTSSQILLLAGSATLGVASQAAILLWSWKRIGLKFAFNFNWRGVGLRPAIKAATWTLAMVLVTQAAGLVQSAVASIPAANRDQIGQGLSYASIAAASIAWLIFMLPHSVFTVSIATAYFTKMTSHAHDNQMQQFKDDLLAGLRVIAMVSILAATGLMVLAYPVSRVFVGEYEGMIALGNVVIAFMIGLLPFSLNFFMQKAFYAIEDTRTPFYTTVAQAITFVSLALVVASFSPMQFIVVNLAIATSIAAIIQTSIAMFVMRKRIGVYAVKLVRAIFKYLVSAAVAGAAGFGLLLLIGGYRESSFAVSSVLNALLASAAIAPVTAVVFFVVLILVRGADADRVMQGVRGSVRRIKGIVGR